MRRAAVLALLTSALLTVPARADSSETGRLLVSLESAGHRAPAAAPAVLARAAARRAGPTVPQIGLVTVRPAGGGSLRELAARLRADPRVRSVSTEHRGRPRFVPNDPALTDAETSPTTPRPSPPATPTSPARSARRSTPSRTARGRSSTRPATARTSRRSRAAPAGTASGSSAPAWTAA